MTNLPEQKYKPDWLTWPYVNEEHETELGVIVLPRRATPVEVWRMFWKWVDGLVVIIDE